MQPQAIERPPKQPPTVAELAYELELDLVGKIVCDGVPSVRVLHALLIIADRMIRDGTGELSVEFPEYKIELRDILSLVSGFSDSIAKVVRAPLRDRGAGLS
jgi:hypothetical protein